MGILDNFIIISLHILSFVAGMKLANYYNEKHQREMKEALQSQYLRLKARADFDDPCKPYGTTIYDQPIKKQILNTGDFDGDEQVKWQAPEKFIQDLKETGKAKVAFRKSDVRKD